MMIQLQSARATDLPGRNKADDDKCECDERKYVPFVNQNLFSIEDLRINFRHLALRLKSATSARRVNKGPQ